MTKKIKLFSILLFTAAVNIFSLNVPKLKGPVNDLAGILTDNRKTEIENFLFEIEKKSDVQIAVLTIPSLEGENCEEYSLRVAETWQLGSKEKDSGVLLLVAVNDKKMRIEVGYGLEASITDAAAGRIIRNVIAPEFKTGNFGNGIFLGVKAIAGCALQDESMLSEINSSDDDSDGFAIIIGLTALLIIWFIFCRLIPCFFWILYRLITLKGFTGQELVTNLFTSRSVFKFSGSSGGGGGYSGGGGSFGGGGASGSW